MTRFNNLKDLVEAKRSGEYVQELPLVLDNDNTVLYPADEEADADFRMHPADLLEQALDLLGIDHENA